MPGQELTAIIEGAGRAGVGAAAGGSAPGRPRWQSGPCPSPPPLRPSARQIGGAESPEPLTCRHFTSVRDQVDLQTAGVSSARHWTTTTGTWRRSRPPRLVCLIRRATRAHRRSCKVRSTVDREASANSQPVSSLHSSCQCRLAATEGWQEGLETLSAQVVGRLPADRERSAELQPIPPGPPRPHSRWQPPAVSPEQGHGIAAAVPVVRQKASRISPRSRRLAPR
jgi:hypothetical protein